MQEGLLLHNFNTIWKYSIANSSCCLCIIVNIMQVEFFSIIRYGSVFILTAHKEDVSEF